MKIVVLGGYSDSLIKFRGELLEKLNGSENEVLALGGDGSARIANELFARGISFSEYPLSRTGLNPFGDLKTFVFLYKCFKREKPDLVFSYTIKPVIWGSIAAKLAGVPKIHSMVTGLGNQLSVATIKDRFVSRIICFLYKQAFICCNSVIFQNGDDQELLQVHGVLDKTSSHVVNGSGVKLTEYAQSALPIGPPVFLTIARFLVAKGIREYAEAARVIKRIRPDVIFQVVGFEEVGKTAIPITELLALHDEGIIELVGKVDNSYIALKQCHIYVLASFYGEGLPRTILEALAVGRPVLTTDSVGCREGVDHGVNGVIVEPRSAKALVAGMQWFLDNEPRWQEMAEASRALAVEKYDVNKVNKEMLRLLGVSSYQANQ